MQVTDVQITLATGSNDSLKAFCSITLDDEFVVKDLRIIGGPQGDFVAMPSRKIMQKCQACSAKIELRSRFCTQCGSPNRKPERTGVNGGEIRTYCDVAHPITDQCREQVEQAVLAAYEQVLNFAELQQVEPAALAKTDTR